MPTTAMPTLLQRVNAALAEVRGRLPRPVQGYVNSVAVQLMSGVNACERVEGKKIFGEWWGQYHTIRLFAGRCQALTDRELETLLAHELAHAFADLTDRGPGENTANDLLERWGYARENLPGWRASQARRDAIPPRGGIRAVRGELVNQFLAFPMPTFRRG
jgi:hypothetical protein